MNDNQNKKLATTALLCAMAYLVMLAVRIPVVLFLKYEPKDVIITLGGFIFGPLTSITISFIVSVLEMLTVSDTGVIGLIMNILASCSFACTAAVIYKKWHTAKGALLGLAAGTVVLTVTMLMWNYVFLPIFMGFPRVEVAKLLFPAILPFNILKGALNTALIILLYKHVVTAMRHSGLIAESTAQPAASRGKSGLLAVAALLLITCVLVILSMKGIL